MRLAVRIGAPAPDSYVLNVHRWKRYIVVDQKLLDAYWRAFDGVTRYSDARSSGALFLVDDLRERGWNIPEAPATMSGGDRFAAAFRAGYEEASASTSALVAARTILYQRGGFSVVCWADVPVGFRMWIPDGDSTLRSAKAVIDRLVADGCDAVCQYTRQHDDPLLNPDWPVVVVDQMLPLLGREFSVARGCTIPAGIVPLVEAWDSTPSNVELAGTFARIQHDADVYCAPALKEPMRSARRTFLSAAWSAELREKLAASRAERAEVARRFIICEGSLPCDLDVD